MTQRRLLRLFLVRHGQVASNREFRYVGSSEEPLTQVGEEQAAALGVALSKVGLRELYCSPLLRTRQTGKSIAAVTAVPLVTEERLREQDFGEWEGLTRAEVKELGERDRERLREVDRDPSVPAPGGESLLEVQERVVAFVKELSDRGDSGPVALVSHVGPIKSFLAYAMGLEISQVRRWFLDPGTITVVDWGEAPLLRTFNSHGHLGWGHAPWMH